MLYGSCSGVQVARVCRVATCTPRTVVLTRTTAVARHAPGLLPRGRVAWEPATWPSCLAGRAELACGFFGSPRRWSHGRFHLSSATWHVQHAPRVIQHGATCLGQRRRHLRVMTYVACRTPHVSPVLCCVRCIQRSPGCRAS
jgi:hypothetical protein